MLKSRSCQLQMRKANESAKFYNNVLRPASIEKANCFSTSAPTSSASAAAASSTAGAGAGTSTAGAGANASAATAGLPSPLPLPRASPSPGHGRVASDSAGDSSAAEKRPTEVILLILVFSVLFLTLLTVPWSGSNRMLQCFA